jgi:hypothetical protein
VFFLKVILCKWVYLCGYNNPEYFLNPFWEYLPASRLSTDRDDCNVAPPSESEFPCCLDDETCWWESWEWFGGFWFRQGIQRTWIHNVFVSMITLRSMTWSLWCEGICWTRRPREIVCLIFHVRSLMPLSFSPDEKSFTSFNDHQRIFFYRKGLKSEIFVWNTDWYLILPFSS